MSFDIDQVNDASRAVETAVLRAEIDPAISLVRAAINLQPDDRARALLRANDEMALRIAAVHAESMVTDEARGLIRGVLEEPDEILAQYLVTSDPKMREALELSLHMGPQQIYAVSNYSKR